MVVKKVGVRVETMVQFWDETKGTLTVGKWEAKLVGVKDGKMV